MYYEEKFIDGRLMYKIAPKGAWKPVLNSVGIVANQLLRMSEENRMKVFSLFCKHCGSSDKNCRCWNDE